MYEEGQLSHVFSVEQLLLGCLLKKMHLPKKHILFNAVAETDWLHLFIHCVVMSLAL